MREIKFRAWDNDCKQYCSGCDIGNLLIGVEFNNDRKSEIIEDKILAKYFTLEQYTGVKDKNGKEIYEGDILGDCWDSCFVQWCDKCKQAQIHTAAGCMACLGDIQWYEFVTSNDAIVIGNIHENPELLEDK